MLLDTPLHAHHAFAAEFDASKPITLSGVVRKVKWPNPHCWLYLDVHDPTTGRMRRWSVEMGSPTQLVRRGWTREFVPPGTQVIVDGYRSKRESRTANGMFLTLPEGKKLSLASSGTPVR